MVRGEVWKALIWLRLCDHLDDLLKRHGGHAMAAGMSIQPENLTAFRKRINAFANQRMKGSCPPPVLHLDADVSLSEFSIDRMEELALCILSDRETLLFNSRVEEFSFGGSLIEWDANSNTRNSGSPTDEPILKCCGGIVGMPPPARLV